MHTISEIFEHFGTKRELARLLGVKPQSLTRWPEFGVPPGAAIKIEKLSNGKFKAINIPLYNGAASAA